MEKSIIDATDVYDYLNKWIQEKGILDGTKTLELKQFMMGLQKQIDKLSFSVEGADKLILYGGWNGEVPMWQVASGAAKSGKGYYYISDTSAGNLLSPSNEQFNNLIMKICDYDKNLIDKIFGNPNPANGIRSPYAVEGYLAINDYISSNLAKNAKGDVSIWVPNGQEHTVFPDTELRMVLKNEQIISINGISKEYFINKYNQYVGENVFLSLDYTELDQSILNLLFEDIKKTKPAEYFDNVAIHYDINGIRIGVDTTSICGGTFVTPKDSVYVLKVRDTRFFNSDLDMEIQYTDYNLYSNLDKLKAKQYDYECTKISDMIDNNLSSQNDIELMSYDDLKTKYTFIDDTTDADVIKELQIAEYRDKKYGTTTTDDIKLYYDENGKMSCVSDQGFESIQDADIKSNSKFSASATDVNNYKNADYMTTICPEYDNLTPVQKLQLQQLELDARNHDMSKLHDFVVNDTTGNLKNVRITYDADGKNKMSLDKPSTGKAWWQDELVSIINNDSVKKINGMTKKNTRGKNRLKRAA